MAGNQQINCEVEIPKELRHGRFANAFRILPDGPEFLLDFLVYSHQADSAVLVARIRVQETFIHTLRATLGKSIKEVDPKTDLFLSDGSKEVH